MAFDGASRSSSSTSSSSSSNPSMKLSRQTANTALTMSSYPSGTRAWYQVRFFWPSSSGRRALSSIRHRAASLITLETVYFRITLFPILRFIDKLPRQQMSGSALATLVIQSFLMFLKTSSFSFSSAWTLTRPATMSDSRASSLSLSGGSWDISFLLLFTRAEQRFWCFQRIRCNNHTWQCGQGE